MWIAVQLHCGAAKEVDDPDEFWQNLTQVTQVRLVYHQVQAWLEQDLDPTEWGWKIKEGCHVPVTSQLPAAPDEILEIIHCGCKTGCKQHQCSCVRHGIMCGPGFVNCTDNCENRADSDDLFCENCSIFSKLYFSTFHAMGIIFSQFFFDF